MPHLRSALLLVLAALALAVALRGGPALAPATADAARPLPGYVGAVRFGVYPGGDAGGTDGVLRAQAVDPGRRLAMIRGLRAGRRDFVLHEYAAFHDAGSFAAAVPHVDQVLRDAAATGCQVELVLRYQPSDREPAHAVPAYLEFVRQVARTYGPRRELVGLQITNEANVVGAPAAADGDYPGVAQALVEGVATAAAERDRLGHRHLAIGFNAAHDLRGHDFWTGLRRSGGPAFARAVDYVGLDVYPGTWPTPARRPPSSHAVRTTVRRSLARLRANMRRAGLGRRVAVHVSENGYPTGPGRSERTQARVLRASVAAVLGARRRYGVSDYRWFDLRDADSGSADFQSRYGLLRDDLSPKPAFAALRALVARHG
ncbi:hypothetical protein [Patulibacter defluvii]|uniref:hypothetical protein n=1 Tax=Patulibacter defluvii TaxID=3095358 RepID=UPI002A761771|nr:hypothetical protein [Patulibacter sp. DM4]